MKYLTEIKVTVDDKQDIGNLAKLYFNLYIWMQTLHPKFTYPDENTGLCHIKNIALQSGFNDNDLFVNNGLVVSVEFNCQKEQLEIVTYTEGTLYMNFWERLAKKYYAKVSYAALNVDGNKNLTNELIPTAEKEFLNEVLIDRYKDGFQEMYETFRKNTFWRKNWNYSPIYKTI